MKSLAAVVCLTFVVLGCSCSKDGDKAAESSAKNKQSKDKKAPAAATGGDWSKRAIAPVNAVVDGVAFTVSLPDKLKQEIKKSDGSFPGYVTWRDNGSFDAPGFTAQLDAFPPENIGAAATAMMGMKKDRTVGLKEALTDGYLVASHEASKKFLHVKIWRKYAKGKYVGFSMLQRMSTAIPNFEAQRAWLVKVARTFKVTKPAK